VESSLSHVGSVAPRSARSALLATALLCAPAHALAAETATADAAAADVAADSAVDGGEEILVSARRRSESLQDVPVAITSIGGEAIGRLESIRTANDITSIVPNASAAATDGRTRPRWFLRGVGTNDTGANTVSPIGIYNDDVYLNNVYLQGFPLFDIDHVEVLRGPQGTLWGKNTTGGAVSIVSRRPQVDKTEGWFKAGYGSYSSVLLQGALNVPIVTDRLAVRVSASHDQRDGYTLNLYDGRKRGAYKDDALRGQLLFKATETLDLNLNLHGRRLRGDKRVSNYFPDLQQTGPYNNGYVDPPGRDRIDIADNNAVENLDSFGSSLTANLELGDYTLTSITAYEEGQRLLTDVA
jgi:iron complex outermembrane receptor protein